MTDPSFRVSLGMILPGVELNFRKLLENPVRDCFHSFDVDTL